jgi:LacI family transcriptional regulator
MCYPPLTTISQPLVQMGEKAGEMLTALIHGNKTTAESIYLPFTIAERQSVMNISKQ